MPLNPFKHFKFNLQLIDFISSLRISACSILWREGLDRGGPGKLRSRGRALILHDQSPCKWGRLGLETEAQRDRRALWRRSGDTGVRPGVWRLQAEEHLGPGSWERNTEHRLPWSLARECGPAVTVTSHFWPPTLSDKK